MKKNMRENELILLAPVDLESEIHRLHDELIDERDRNLRTLADFNNYRRRIEREGNKIVEERTRKMILPLLDIIDDIEKALESAESTKLPFFKGLQMIRNKFLSVLESFGVVPFDCVGMPFDHNLHEAVAMAAHEGSEPRTVMSVLRPGYLLNNELFRAAQVRVSG